VIISTFVGGIFSGALVFTSHQFRVGDSILREQHPRKDHRHNPDSHQDKDRYWPNVHTNSAIASGSVIIIALHKYKEELPGRLPYIEGDRVVTTYMSGEGIVKELTPLHTVVLLDSGRELTF